MAGTAQWVTKLNYLHKKVCLKIYVHSLVLNSITSQWFSISVGEHWGKMLSRLGGEGSELLASLVQRYTISETICFLFCM